MQGGYEPQEEGSAFEAVTKVEVEGRVVAADQGRLESDCMVW